MLHKVRFETKNGRTLIWLDDKQIEGCTSATFSYDIKAFPVVHLELLATEVTVDADCADVKKVVRINKGEQSFADLQKTGKNKSDISSDHG